MALWFLVQHTENGKERTMMTEKGQCKEFGVGKRKKSALPILLGSNNYHFLKQREDAETSQCAICSMRRIRRHLTYVFFA